MSTAPTPETLPRHELVGLDAEVVSASNPDAVGLSGEVVMETTQTLGLTVESEEPRSSNRRTESDSDGELAHVAKAEATFAFTLPASDEVVTVDGEKLVARPARRTEKQGDSKWR
jgi:ribonuclease P protein subunit POP4